MLSRLERKLAEIRRWVDSVGSFADWPAALALSIYRTRPAEGDGRVARWSRRLVPYIRVRPATLNGLSVRLNPAEMSQFVIYEEVFIERVYDLGRVSFTPDLILDCGAFEGYFSLLAAARFPGVPITAFEPNAKNREGLTANVRVNHLGVEVKAAAVSTRDGTATFSGGGCGGKLGAAADAVVVPVEDLCRVIAARKPERLLLKLDIEGEEATLLPALVPGLPKTCAIFFEWHEGRAEYQRAAALLDAHGFTTSLTRENAFDGGCASIDAFAQRG